MKQQMQNHHGFDLKSLNSFNVRALAKSYIQVCCTDQVKEWCKKVNIRREKYFVLGGGTNTLFVGDFPGTVLHVNLKGIEVMSKNESDSEVSIKAASGELWDDLVQFSLRKGYWGLENLSMIPGTVGGAAVQNVGAYGTDLGHVLEYVETFNLITGKSDIFDKTECQLGYRSSFFKTDPSHLITSVTVRLSKQKNLCLGYHGILSTLPPDEEISLDTVRNVICNLRQKKLPDPKKLPNAGSFFKNPVITEDKYLHIKRKHPGMVCYESEDNVKISAAWLIDRAGCRTLINDGDNVGLFKNHALVVVNFGQGSGFEIFDLAEAIKKRVQEIFDLELCAEVVIVK